GASELDMVINVGGLKSADDELVARDIAGVVDVAHEVDYICKVILETGLLTEEEKVRGCLLAKQAGADFVKTSTGFSKGGATVADIALMRRVVGGEMGVKASGGVRDLKQAQEMIRAGATRIGASVGVKIVQEAAGAKPPTNGEGVIAY
ncbi:MAG TPA: deoxyribose-phosphate aldolase, partial [Blastocatellia bacterium]|nr:deoxyribose-phosphate aldolase [Blastocatellia bacterium]